MEATAIEMMFSNNVGEDNNLPLVLAVKVSLSWNELPPLELLATRHQIGLLNSTGPHLCLLHLSLSNLQGQ